MPGGAQLLGYQTLCRIFVLFPDERTERHRQRQRPQGGSAPQFPLYVGGEGGSSVAGWHLDRDPLSNFFGQHSDDSFGHQPMAARTVERSIRRELVTLQR